MDFVVSGAAKVVVPRSLVLESSDELWLIVVTLSSTDDFATLFGIDGLPIVQAIPQVTLAAASKSIANFSDEAKEALPASLANLEAGVAVSVSVDLNKLLGTFVHGIKGTVDVFGATTQPRTLVALPSGDLLKDLRIGDSYKVEDVQLKLLGNDWTIEGTLKSLKPDRLSFPDINVSGTLTETSLTFRVDIGAGDAEPGTVQVWKGGDRASYRGSLVLVVEQDGWTAQLDATMSDMKFQFFGTTINVKTATLIGAKLKSDGTWSFDEVSADVEIAGIELAFKSTQLPGDQSDTTELTLKKNVEKRVFIDDLVGDLAGFHEPVKLFYRLLHVEISEATMVFSVSAQYLFVDVTLSDLQLRLTKTGSSLPLKGTVRDQRHEHDTCVSLHCHAFTDETLLFHLGAGMLTQACEIEPRLAHGH